MRFELKVYVKSRESIILVTPDLKNTMWIHDFLNKKYGITGWLGFDILQKF